MPPPSRPKRAPQPKDGDPKSPFGGVITPGRIIIAGSNPPPHLCDNLRRHTSDGLPVGRTRRGRAGLCLLLRARGPCREQAPLARSARGIRFVGERPVVLGQADPPFPQVGRPTDCQSAGKLKRVPSKWRGPFLVAQFCFMPRTHPRRAPPCTARRGSSRCSSGWCRGPGPARWTRAEAALRRQPGPVDPRSR